MNMRRIEYKKTSCADLEVQLVWFIHYDGVCQVIIEIPY